MQIRTYNPQDEDSLLALWTTCGLLRPRGDARTDIARKVAFQPDLMLVGEKNGQIVACIMAGYDGFRGWLNFMGVHPDYRQRGLGLQIVREAERCLQAMGCVQINIQVREGNPAGYAFWEKAGFNSSNRVKLLGMDKLFPVENA